MDSDTKNDTIIYYDTELIKLTDIAKINETVIKINDENVNYFTSIIDAKDLHTYSVNDYSWNRDLNQKHVDQIFNDLSKMENPHLIGTFKIIHNKRFEESYIFDGQHRSHAIKKKIAENKFDSLHPWKINITIEVYSIDCEKIEDSKIAEYLFCMANKVRVFDINHLIDTYIQDIAKSFQKDIVLGSGINTGQNNTCNSIKIKDLFNSLKIHFNPVIRPTISEVIKIIKEKNYQISVLELDQVFPNYKSANQKNQLIMRNKFIRAKKTNFCLNLETYPPSKWITEIVEKINKK